MSLEEIWDLFEKEGKEDLAKAEQGDSYAQYLVALRYKQGMGFIKDMGQYFYWLNKSAANNQPKARRDLADCYFNGDGVAVDKGKAFILVLENAQDGCKYSQFLVGSYYYHGIGTNQNTDKAKYWLKKAALQGHEDAVALLHQIKGRPYNLYLED